MHHEHHEHADTRHPSDDAPRARGPVNWTGANRADRPTTQIIRWTDEQGSVVRLVTTSPYATPHD